MKRKLKTLFQFAGWLILIGAIGVTLAFSHVEISGVPCADIEIRTNDNDPVKLSRQQIVRIVNSVDKNIKGKKLNEINSEELEQEIEKNNAVLKASVYKMVVRDTADYRGILTVKIKHRVPIIRVMSSNGNYYMDENGQAFPSTQASTGKVLVVTGNVREEFARENLLPVVQFITSDDFWNAQIKQIHVNGNEELLLTPLVGDQIIEFGTTEKYREKFRNLMAFYDEVLANSNWDKYERINLKYNNQIIGKKRD